VQRSEIEVHALEQVGEPVAHPRSSSSATSSEYCYADRQQY
jgi:hypothetical protein